MTQEEKWGPLGPPPDIMDRMNDEAAADKAVLVGCCLSVFIIILIWISALVV